MRYPWKQSRVNEIVLGGSNGKVRTNCVKVNSQAVLESICNSATNSTVSCPLQHSWYMCLDLLHMSSPTRDDETRRIDGSVHDMCLYNFNSSQFARRMQPNTDNEMWIYIYIYIYIKGRCVSDLERFQSVSHDVSNRCCRADRRRRLCRKCHSVSAAAAAAAAALVGCMDMTLYSIASQALLLLLQCAVRNICSAIYNLAETRSYTWDI